MADELKLKNAQSVYKILCDLFDEKELSYKKFEDDLVVTITMHGNDLPMNFVVKVDEERELIRVLTKLPVVFQDEKRLDGAIATGKINYGLVDGSFDYNFKKGEIIFRLTSSYKGCTVSKDLIYYMMSCACYTVDDYNDKLLALSEGKITVKDFFDNK
ncbi:MAG: hypothetical protein K2O28_00615 [Clostridia bacterium]|nr:hypothetical protein [Clostridia bacterium]